ncbi:hypothetical protein TIFTF001_033999 [Ficus carica]|uniref:Uncharacterized protein n=1 Tax=Ficus carica TaxID=3494 RepID=A0AA88E6C3_FICCA|nr:hypothetical protein TIFTF001_033999 [Ficus carica]
MASVFMKNRTWSAQTQCGSRVHGQQEYELLSCHVGTINQERRTAVCYGMLWYNVVSNLPAISNAILWNAGAADCEMWDGHRHGF